MDSKWTRLAFSFPTNWSGSYSAYRMTDPFAEVQKMTLNDDQRIYHFQRWIKMKFLTLFDRHIMERY